MRQCCPLMGRICCLHLYQSVRPYHRFWEVGLNPVREVSLKVWTNRISLSYWLRKTWYGKFRALKFSKRRFMETYNMETCIFTWRAWWVTTIVFREKCYFISLYKQNNINKIATLQHSIKMIYGSIYYESFHRSLLDDAIQYPVSSDVGLNSQWIVRTHFSLCPELITLATMSGNGWRLLYCAKWSDC